MTTIVGLLIWLGVASVCSAAARRVIIAKGRDQARWAAAGFFGGVFGLAGAVFVQPSDGSDRLAWWNESPTARTWTKLATGVLVLGVAVYATLVVAVPTASAPPRKIDPAALNSQIKKWLADNGSPRARVTCPSAPIQAGYTFICTASDATGSAQIEVTIVNDQGQVRWQVIG